LLLQDYFLKELRWDGGSQSSSEALCSALVKSGSFVRVAAVSSCSVLGGWSNTGDGGSSLALFRLDGPTPF